MAATPRSARGYAALVMVLAGLVLAGLASWVLFSPEEALPPYAGSDGTGTAAAPSTPFVPVEAESGGVPVRPQATQTHSPYVKASVTVLLSVPKWMGFPATTRLELQPRADNQAAPLILWATPEKRSVRFDDVPFGPWTLRAEPLDCQVVEIPFSLSEANPAPRQVVPVQAARRIHGRVRDSAGEAVAGITVSASPVIAVAGFTVSRASGTTDAEGMFEIPGLPEGEFRVHAGTHQNPVGEAVHCVVVGPEGWADLIVPRMSSAQVTLLDATSEKPLAALRVQALRASGADEPGFSSVVDSDELGVAQFLHLPPGEYHFTAWGRGYKRLARRWMVGADRPATLELKLSPLSRGQ